jgi:phosphoribosylaminoimidazole-succinocarboxamide synthase
LSGKHVQEEFMTTAVVQESNVKGFPLRRGKVRDIYDLGEELLIVATDRISAFDWVLPTPIPDKGRVLTSLSHFWFQYLGIPNHYISMDLEDMPAAFAREPRLFQGRSMLVKKTKVIPAECVVRGYLAGSGWQEYRQSGRVCGVELPGGLRESQQLPEPIFTPATKEETGHDLNITFQQLSEITGSETAHQLRRQSMAAYSRAASHARGRDLIIADTKFEWGTLPNGSMLLIDEVLTPDSSRFWPASEWRAGSSPPSFDKQFVRDWLASSGWDKNSPPPPLPEDVVAKTRSKYLDAHMLLTGKPLEEAE